MIREIGNTGARVRAIGLGAMPMSIKGRPDEQQSIDVIHTAIYEGVNFIDTANAYCLDDSDTGHNERLIAKALNKKNLWPKVRLATKGGLTRPNGEWRTDGRPESLRKACEKSLQDLGRDSIFLYQLHAPDSKVPFADSVGEMARLKEEGKIEHVGLSNVNTDEIKTAQEIVRVETVQNRFNPFLSRDLGNGVVDHCREHKITYIAHSPVGGHAGHTGAAQNELLTSLAKQYNISPYCIMLAWVLSKGEHTLPIPGASKKTSILDSLKAMQVKLAEVDIKKLDTQLPETSAHF